MKRQKTIEILFTCVCAFTLSVSNAGLPPAYAADPPARESESDKLAYAASATTTGISPGAAEAANLLGIMPDVEKLIAVKQSVGADSFNDELMTLKVRILDKVMGQSLEVRMVADRIDRELSWSFTGRDMIEAKRQRNLNFLFSANFMQGGILGVLSGPEFLTHHNRAGTNLLLLASSIGLGLSTLSLVESRLGSKSMDGEATVLADLFGIDHPEAIHHHDLVMRFLNSVPPGSSAGLTRKDLLMHDWEKGHYLHSKSERELQKLAAVQSGTSKYREDIGLLSNRIRMLFDVQWTIEQLDGELLDLLRITD